MKSSTRARPWLPPKSAFAGFRFPPGVIVVAVRWYQRYNLSYRDWRSYWSSAAWRSTTSPSIARPGVSRHLRVLREAGLVEVRQQAQRRIYSLRPQPLAEVDEWLGRYRALWEQRLDALHTEVARGKHERRSTR